MSVSFELHRDRQLSWKLQDHPYVVFVRLSDKQWHVVGAGSAASQLSAAGIPLGKRIDGSLGAIAQICAQVLECSPALTHYRVRYVIGNTRFLVARIGTGWKLALDQKNHLTPQFAALYRRHNRHRSLVFPTRQAAVEQLQQWYRETEHSR